MINWFVRRGVTTALFFAGLACVNPAAHGILVTSSGINGSALPGATYVNFDAGEMTPGLTISSTGTAGIVSGASDGQYAPPFVAAGNSQFFNTTDGGVDTTPYAYVAGTSSSTPPPSITFTFTSGQSYFGLLWGSVDQFNSLNFLNASGVSVGTITGGDLSPPLMNNGSQGSVGSGYVNIFSDTAFFSVVATSAANSFEFDNVAFSATPEPSSLILCGAGVISLAVVKVRRKRKV